MKITQNQNKAVDDIVEMIVSEIGNGSRELDTIDAISSTARLAGSFMFRSFQFEINDVKPGTVMLSEEANIKGPQLVDLTFLVLQKLGVHIDNNKMSNGNQEQPKSNFLDAIGKIQDPALEIMKKNDLSYEQMAQSAAIATAFIIQQSKNITPEEGFSTAIYYYIDGTKTSPPEFSDEAKRATDTKTQIKENNNSKNINKAWWKFW